jgi:hypothetical protein
MHELPPTRIFFDGGMAEQMRDEINVEEQEVGMTADAFGTVAENRLYDGTGTTALRPTARWELRVDVNFRENCSAIPNAERVFANAVTDFVNIPNDEGMVSKFPQTASYGCELLRFSLLWDEASQKCKLVANVIDFELCSASSGDNSLPSIISGYFNTVGRDFFVSFASEIPFVSADSSHSLIVKIKDPSVDTAVDGLQGHTVVDTADGTEFEVFWNGQLLSDTLAVDNGQHPNIVVPNTFLPNGLTDVFLYTMYNQYGGMQFSAGDRVTSFLYSYDIVFAAGRRRKLQEVIESHKYITISDDSRAICACTDGLSNTPCITAGSENAWIKFDMGSAVHVKGLEIMAWGGGVESPNPPPNPPPNFPPSPPPSPPLPPPPPRRSPPPSTPPSPPLCEYLVANTCVVNLVSHTNDGVCDDGGVVADNFGLVDAETSICELGTDYDDCGERCIPFPPNSPPSTSSSGRRLSEAPCEDLGSKAVCEAHAAVGLCSQVNVELNCAATCGLCPSPPPLPPPPPLPLPPEAGLGPLELWASDTSSFFGSLVTVFPYGLTSHAVSTRIDHATPHRYWTLRAYNPDQRMRLDSMRFFGESDDGSVRSSTQCATAAFPDVSVASGSAPGYVLSPGDSASTTLPFSNPPPPPVVSTIVYSQYTGRRLRQETSLRREMEMLWKSTLKAVSEHPPKSHRDAMEMLKKLLISRGVTIGDMSLQNWTDAAIANATAALRPKAEKHEFVNISERDAWWNRMEEHHDELDTTGLFGTYPTRTPPKAFGRSPAASLVTALAMTNASESSLPEALTAEAFLINSSCAHLSGCDFHEHMLTSSPILGVDFDAMHPFTSTFRDDGAWLTWVLSASIGPTVHLVSSQMLACASTTACGPLCLLCNHSKGVGMRDNEPVEIVRAVERALVGGGDASLDVVTCIQTASCIEAISESAAAALGSFVVSAKKDVDVLADANLKLWSYARTEMEANASFHTRRAERAQAAHSHQRAVGAKTIPDWVRPHVVENGRRLDDHQAEALNGDFGDNETKYVEWIRSLSPSERQLFVASHHSAYLLQSNASYGEVSKAHMQFIQTYARVGSHMGEKPNRMGTCADPQFVNRTISCRVHTVLVGKALTHLRNEAKRDAAEKSGATGSPRARRRASNEPEIREHINRKLAESCCARFEDGREECGEQYCEHHITREVTKRMASVIKRLTDENHPSSAKVGPDIHAIIENVLLPETHPDPECRTINMSSLYFGGPTRSECTGRSLLKHASKRYGVDSDTIERKLQEFGISAGASLQKMQAVTGMFSEVRSAGNKLKRKREKAAKANAAAKAAKLLREATKKASSSSHTSPHGRRMQETGRQNKRSPTPGMRHAERRRRKLQDAQNAMSDEELARTLSATRGTDVPDGKNRHGFAHSAATVKENRASLRNATDEIGESFKRLEKRAHSERLQRMADGRKGGSRMDKTPRAMSFHRDNFMQHIINPVLAVEILQADEGSLTSRFSSGLRKLSEISKRWSNVHLDAHRIQVERRRRRARELSEDDTKKYATMLYDKLDAEQQTREDAEVAKIANTMEGRRLQEATIRSQVKAAVRRRIPEIKPDHGLAWVHELVDWHSASEEWYRVHDLLTKRNEMRMQGRKMNEILRAHPTGYAVLDDHERFAFSRFGDALRRMWHRRVNGTDAHFVNHTRSHLDHAGKHSPERHGRLRRLSEGFLGPVLAAPYAFVDTVVYGSSRSISVPSTKEDVFTAAIRYLVYGTIGCYLTEPQYTVASTSISNPDDPTEGSDGDTLKVFRPGDTYLCFPGPKRAV